MKIFYPGGSKDGTDSGRRPGLVYSGSRARDNSDVSVRALSYSGVPNLLAYLHRPDGLDSGLCNMGNRLGSLHEAEADSGAEHEEMAHRLGSQAEALKAAADPKHPMAHHTTPATAKNLRALAEMKAKAAKAYKSRSMAARSRDSKAVAAEHKTRQVEARAQARAAAPKKPAGPAKKRFSVSDAFKHLLKNAKIHLPGKG